MRSAVFALAVAPYAVGAIAAAAVCGHDLVPPVKDDPVDSAAPDQPGQPSPRESPNEKSQEVTYEPWELVST